MVERMVQVIMPAKMTINQMGSWSSSQPVAISPARSGFCARIEVPMKKAHTSVRNTRTTEISSVGTMRFSSRMAKTRWKYIWLVIPPGTRERNQLSRVNPPTAKRPFGKLIISGGRTSTTLEKPPAILRLFIVTNTPPMTMTMPKIKSVQATVLRPAGRTKAMQAIARQVISTFMGMPVMRV